MQNKATKGLATLALLKVYYDKGQDYLGIFMPFVLDAIARNPDECFVTAEIKESISTLHSLEIPEVPLSTLLSRAVSKGYLNREAGRYFRLPSCNKIPDILIARESIENEHYELARHLCAFAESVGLKISTKEEALTMIEEFIERNHLSLIIPTQKNLVDVIEKPFSRIDKIVARYFETIIRS